uniref:NADH-ubiquinone oxidoreductase chain 3 n=1 Tax=Cardiocondyla obscurior TaxID=286306 RepID=A0A343AXT9_9HYME|nr:NADH dehydrogenase subunit 3 [Cardiocondyla obscurior]
MIFMYMLILISLISLLMILMNFLFSKKSFQDREKISPFECGFDPISSNYLPFSIHFFLISLIFLIFDIEITILIPLIHYLKYFNLHLIFTSMIFLLILIMSLFFEYLEQSIDWKI